MRLFTFFLLFVFPIYSLDLCDHLKSFDNTTPKYQLEEVDAIYLINLDKRPEKLSSSLTQLNKYDLTPYRLSAIDGKTLTKKVLQDIGLIYRPGMKPGPVTFDPAKKETSFLKTLDYGRACFFEKMTMGALGCSLSHLSILKNAYDANHEVIWVLEDDFILEKDPHLLSQKIQQLNQLVGKENWDILFTDDFHYFNSHDKHSYWRPDLKEIVTEFLRNNFSKVEAYKKLSDKKATVIEKLESAQIKKILNYSRIDYFLTPYPDCLDSFRKISGRWATHSMIIKRSGIKKILSFIQQRGIFLPYDDELSMIPGLKMFNLKESITYVEENDSDTNH